MKRERDAESASLRTLFPELTAPDSGVSILRPRSVTTVDMMTSTVEEDAARLSRGGRRVFVLVPGVLRTPQFRKRVPWISGTVATIWQNGVAQPGWLETALATSPAAAAVAQAKSLADRLVGEELGGTFWAAPPDLCALRPGRVLVQAGRDRSCAARMLGAALARGDAARTVLLLRQPDRELAAMAARYGCAVLSGPADPWPLLAGANALHASGDDPLALLALLAGYGSIAMDW